MENNNSVCFVAKIKVLKVLFGSIKNNSYIKEN